jgi:hypothetical protein
MGGSGHELGEPRLVLDDIVWLQLEAHVVSLRAVVATRHADLAPLLLDRLTIATVNDKAGRRRQPVIDQRSKVEMAHLRRRSSSVSRDVSGVTRARWYLVVVLGTDHVREPHHLHVQRGLRHVW